MPVESNRSPTQKTIPESSFSQVRFLPSLDISTLDSQSTCDSDKQIRFLAFEGINSHTARFMWLNVKHSNWRSTLAIGDQARIVRVDKEALMDRCREKVEKDIAILNIEVELLGAKMYFLTKIID